MYFTEHIYNAINQMKKVKKNNSFLINLCTGDFLRKGTKMDTFLSLFIKIENYNFKKTDKR